MNKEYKKAPFHTSTRMKQTRSTADPNATTDTEDKRMKTEERVLAILGTRSTADPNATTDAEDKRMKTEERVKRRKMAMMFAYSGVGYFGLQRNQGMKTIEGDIMEALFKAGFVTEDSFNTPQNIQFQRAARTDKGVSALKQIVSLKLPEEANKEAINEHLPEQIRILSIKRVTKGFNSKNNCNARTYSYTCPTYAFATPQDTKDDFRLTPDQFNFLQALLKQYEGTHNFHNFTSKRKPLDPSCSRYIMSFDCEQPFVKDGLELITLKIKGQSFMLHQIRKMVGVAMAIARGFTSKDLIEKTFGLDQFDLPMAPGLGLLLEQVHYDLYNQKYGQDGMHESLHFHEVDKEVNEFRHKFILPYLVKTEITEKPMLAWLELLADHSFETRAAKAALAAANGEELQEVTDGEEEEDEEDRGGVRHSNGTSLAPKPTPAVEKETNRVTETKAEPHVNPETAVNTTTDHKTETTDLKFESADTKSPPSNAQVEPHDSPPKSIADNLEAQLENKIFQK
ncbi:tRNA pseudouridine synthase A [Diaphorina citri]|uniref:Pseudouridylate synthase 1 homolog n=1 Tax=Diaphorina citri TaxID=121845 RepID=A0A3Q0IU94_DIACI|nr:tRNA pseudouridine synthase A [Diaphorina citri]